ncbi:MAG TPA: stage V sporulation protein AA [Bacillales bacterium]|nr:stage V sporulation protein AA [Bacillales bacterium]
MEREVIYLRMRHRILVEPDKTVCLRDVAQIAAPSGIQKQLSDIVIHRVKPSDQKFVVIDALQAIRAIHRMNPNLEVQAIGPAQAIIEIHYPKKTLAPVYFCGVWVLLFIGAALAIMNFHEDVAMQDVQQKIYQIITGESKAKPLIMQIPYSLGLGIGMILFFNHLFRKRFNEEPSPLEVEMFNYQQDLDRYVSFHEKKESGSNPNGD